MYRKGRPVVPDVPPDEKLFFRCLRDAVDMNNRVAPAHIRFPDQSANRERFSKPTDVLLPDETDRSRSWILYGVAMFMAGALPTPMSTDGGVKYSFTAEHDPEQNNYGHTELRAYKNGERLRKKPNRMIKKEYRTKLAERTLVVVEPLIGTSDLSTARTKER